MVSHLPPEVNCKVFFPGNGRAVEGAISMGLTCRVVQAPASLDVFEKQALRWSWGKRLAVCVKDLLPYTYRLCRLIRNERVDIVHCNDARSILLIGPAALLANKPVIWHLREINFLAEHGLLNRLTHRLSTVAVTVADALRSGIMPKLPSRTIYNGVVAPEKPISLGYELEEMMQGRGLSLGDTFIVMAASSFQPWKGHHHLLGALALLFENRPELKKKVVALVLGVGDNETRRRYEFHLRDLAEELGVEENLIWLGWRQDASSLMCYADVVCLPTINRETLVYKDGTRVEAVCSEGLPRVVLEAMAAGRPVIASDVAGVSEALTEDAGILVEPGNEKELCGALLRLIEDEEMRVVMGQAGRVRARAFAPENGVRQMTELYRELTEQKHSRLGRLAGSQKR